MSGYVEFSNGLETGRLEIAQFGHRQPSNIALADCGLRRCSLARVRVSISNAFVSAFILLFHVGHQKRVVTELPNPETGPNVLLFQNERMPADIPSMSSKRSPRLRLRPHDPLSVLVTAVELE